VACCRRIAHSPLLAIPGTSRDITLKNRIIPCLYAKAGRVVKSINFVDLVDAGDPGGCCL